MNKPIIVIVTCECVIRHKDGKLKFLGQPDNPLRDAVQRENEGRASEADRQALDVLPVFDEDAPEHSEIEIMEVTG